MTPQQAIHVLLEADRETLEAVDRATPGLLDRVRDVVDVARAGIAPAPGDRQSVSSIPDPHLVKRAVLSAVPRGDRDVPRWSAVSETFALGSTYSKQLCRRFDLDPDVMLTATPADNGALDADQRDELQAVRRDYLWLLEQLEYDDIGGGMKGYHLRQPISGNGLEPEAAIRRAAAEEHRQTLAGLMAVREAAEAPSP